jgi:hypothetical protein
MPLRINSSLWLYSQDTNRRAQVAFSGVDIALAIRHINSMPLKLSRTPMMNCPNCGAIMVWLNGSVLHDPPVKQYECRGCKLFVVKYQDGNYEVIPTESEEMRQQ